MKTEVIDGKTLERWSPEEVAKAHAAGEVALIDVRTPQEYMLEHVEGALLLPLPFFDPRFLPSQEGKKLILYCGSGMRSGKAARMVIEAGLPAVPDMEGGFGAWKKAKLGHIGTDLASGAPKRVDPGT